MSTAATRALSAATLVATLSLLAGCVTPTNPHKDDEPNEDTGQHDKTGMITPSELDTRPADRLPVLATVRPLA